MLDVNDLNLPVCVPQIYQKRKRRFFALVYLDELLVKRRRVFVSFLLIFLFSSSLGVFYSFLSPELGNYFKFLIVSPPSGSIFALLFITVVYFLSGFTVFGFPLSLTVCFAFSFLCGAVCAVIVGPFAASDFVYIAAKLILLSLSALCGTFLSSFVFIYSRRSASGAAFIFNPRVLALYISSSTVLLLLIALFIFLLSQII